MAEAARADAVALGPGLGRIRRGARARGAAARAASSCPSSSTPTRFTGWPGGRRAARPSSRRTRASSRACSAATPVGRRPPPRGRASGAETFGAVVLQGQRTRSCRPRTAVRLVCDAGPPSLATAGTGDVLTGVTRGVPRQGPRSGRGRRDRRHRARAGRLVASRSPGRARRERRRRLRSHACSPDPTRAVVPSVGGHGSMIIGVRVEILGSGGAATIPRPGCRCRVCVEARAQGGRFARTGPSTFVHGPNILFDTPEESKFQLERCRDRRDRRLLLLALAPGPHDGASGLGDAQRRLPHLAPGGEAPARHRRLPAAAGRGRLSHLARWRWRTSSSCATAAGSGSTSWATARRSRSVASRCVRSGSQRTTSTPSSWPTGHGCSWSRWTSSTAGRLHPRSGAATWPCCRWGSASSTSSPASG